jgi:hypothetical protein
MKRLAVVLLLTMGLLAGCGRGSGGSLTRSNYDKIQEGMTLAEVESLLGKGKLVPLTDQVPAGPAQAQEIARLQAEGLETYLWESGDKMVKVQFQRGKMVRKDRMGL